MLLTEFRPTGALLEVDEKELLTIWLADKVLHTVECEGEVKYDALVYAQI